LIILTVRKSNFNNSISTRYFSNILYEECNLMNQFTKTLTLLVFVILTGCASAPQDLSQLDSASAATTGTLASEIPSAGMPSTGAATGMVGNAASSSIGGSQAPSLVGILVQQLGISPQQATGGAGSIFSLAKQSMSPASFGQVSNAVPGMGQLLAAAPALGGSTTGTGSLMGSAASALGGSSLGNMAALAGSFQSLGMGSGMMNQFLPIILQYVQGTGGSSTMGLLQSALMP
jgi:hypothetical protein